VGATGSKFARVLRKKMGGTGKISLKILSKIL
jgi:hypothetical protein